MKDELNELELDASTRKTATDWLMQVISGKKLTTLNGNGTALNGNGNVNGAHALAVAEPLREEERTEPEPAAPEITAEDLCGAPAVPIIKTALPAKDEITADDVCWVPVERRLSAQPDVAAETFGPRLHIVQSPAREPLAETVHEPAAPALDIWRDSPQAKAAEEAEITAADISRDATAYPVEPIWNGTANHDYREAFERDAHEVTAADISRGGTREQLSELGIVDLPSSFRVIRTVMPPVEAAGPVIDAVTPVVEAAAAPVMEAPAEGVVEIAGAGASGVAEQQGETARHEEGAVVGDSMGSADSTGSGIPADGVAGEQVSSEIVTEQAPAAPEPNEADLRQMEASLAATAAEPVEAEAGSEAAVPAEAEVAAVVETPIVAEIAADTEVPAEASTEASREAEEKSAENVFAREGFWGATAAAGEAAASGEEMSPKSLLRGLKRAYQTPEEAAESETHPEGWVSAWKTLLRLGAVLPWVARALPALEAGAMGAPVPDAAAPGVAQETRQDVAGLRLVQYEIRTTVQDHSMQLKRMEEQLTRVRESMESQASASGELAESVRSMTKLVRLAAMGLGGLLAVLIVLVAVMAAHH